MTDERELELPGRKAQSALSKFQIFNSGAKRTIISDLLVNGRSCKARKRAIAEKR